MRRDDQRELVPAARGTTPAWRQAVLPLLLAWSSGSALLHMIVDE